MFLTAKRFFWSNPKDKKEKARADTITKLFPEMEKDKLNYVIFEVGYWRKANHIHNWFVRNVQYGDDDCGTYYVSQEALKELKQACIKALKFKGVKRNNALDSILPTQDGFFFGNTEYDEDYFKDCKKTIDIINRVLCFPQEWEVEYHSSW